MTQWWHGQNGDEDDAAVRDFGELVGRHIVGVHEERNMHGRHRTLVLSVDDGTRLEIFGWLNDQWSVVWQ